MVRKNTVTEHKRTPQGAARAEVQRERILVAAQKCFVAHGFHAASMASISDTAQMSAGLIYRYFSSKNEIILAIIARELQENRESIATLKTSSDLVARMADIFTRWRSGASDVVNPVLFLEMTAQASRDPQIAEALESADRVLAVDVREWLLQEARNQRREIPQEEVDARRLALHCFIEGLFVRAVRDPCIDPRTLAESLQRFVLYLIPPREAAASG